MAKKKKKAKKKSKKKTGKKSDKVSNKQKKREKKVKNKENKKKKNQKEKNNTEKKEKNESEKENKKESDEKESKAIEKEKREYVKVKEKESKEVKKAKKKLEKERKKREKAEAKERKKAEKIKKKTEKITNKLKEPKIKKAKSFKLPILFMSLGFFLIIAISAIILLLNNESDAVEKLEKLEQIENGYKDVKSKVGELRNNISVNFGGEVVEENQTKVPEENTREETIQLSNDIETLILSKQKQISNNYEELKKLNDLIQNYFNSVNEIAEDYKNLNKFFVQIQTEIEKLHETISLISFDQTLRTEEEINGAIDKINNYLPKLSEVKQNISHIPAETQNTNEIKEITLKLVKSFENFMNRQIEFLKMKKEALTNRDQKLENRAIELELQIGNDFDTAFSTFIEEKTEFDQKIVDSYNQELTKIQEKEVAIENKITEIRTKLMNPEE